MFKRPQFPWFILLTGLLSTFGMAANAQLPPESPKFPSVPTMTSLGTLSPMSDFTSELTAPTTEDPLGSPYPIPWNWILQTQAEFTEKAASGLRYYRTPSSISPDGRYAVYARIQLQVQTELYNSRVTSVLFLEDLQTGQLQVIRADSPLNHEEVSGLAGSISILLPVSWSKDGNSLLLRQFEGFFSTSDATDYAVVWERQTQRTHTVSPQNIDYDIAILLGWSDLNPDRVLFQAGLLGEEDWSVVSVNLDGQTLLADRNEPIIYGRQAVYPWTGVQALK